MLDQQKVNGHQTSCSISPTLTLHPEMRHRQTFLSSFQSFVMVCSPVNHLFKPLSPVTLNHADPGPVSLLILSLGFLLNGYSNILTVVALFSKTTHFIPTPSRANTKETNHNATGFFYLFTAFPHCSINWHWSRSWVLKAFCWLLVSTTFHCLDLLCTASGCQH